jgi:hypothetical protein
VAVVKFYRTRSFYLLTLQFMEKISLPIFFIILTAVTVGILCPGSFFRYIAPAVPLLILVIAVVVDAAMDVHWLFAAATVIILVATGQIKDYLFEITHDYVGPEKCIASYLNEHGSPDDIAAVSYDDMSLKFYTKMRVLGGLTDEDLEPAKNARWVILRQCELGVKGQLQSIIDSGRYRRIELDCPDICWENREDIENHLFRTSTSEEKVVIYQRVN